ADTTPVLLLDDGDGLAELGRTDRGDIAAGASPEEDDVVVGSHGPSLLARATPRGVTSVAPSRRVPAGTDGATTGRRRRRRQRTESTPRFARASARSFPGSPACPLTHTQRTSCLVTSASSACHRSTFFTGFFAAVVQPLLF